MQWPPTRPGRNPNAFHLVFIASITAFVDMFNLLKTVDGISESNINRIFNIKTDDKFYNNILNDINEINNLIDEIIKNYI